METQPPGTTAVTVEAGSLNKGGNNTLHRRSSSTRRKNTTSKIRNRKVRCQRRRVFANVPLPKDLLDRSGGPRIKYVSNKIITSKYTPLTFIPKNLFEQFRRVANMYFLLMAILGMIPEISVNNPVLTLLPLSTVIFITACKDAYEDYNRHKIDGQFNSSKCYHLQNFFNVNYPSETKQSFWKGLFLKFKNLWKKKSPKTLPSEKNYPTDSQKVVDDDDGGLSPTNEINGRPIFTKVQWKYVRVGDFLFLRNGDAVPADSIILSTSEPEGNCFVETKDLDGETNLKPRRCVPDTRYIGSPEECPKLHCYVDSEAPNSNLYTYNATLTLLEPTGAGDQAQDNDISPNDDIPESRPSSPQNTAIEPPNFRIKKSIPVDINNLLLRAHVIRNTEWVIAMSIFTGTETKIMLNSGETPSKRSRIEKEMNREVIFNFFILIILALICAIGSALSSDALSDETNGVATQLLDSNRNSLVLAGFVTFWASLIIFQNIIPISLYISIEFVKTFQAFFIYSDLDMWDEDSEATCVPKSWNLSDDLGQIEYIFSDKTGTLTRNIMEFRQCSIGGKVYGNNSWAGKTDAEKGKELADPDEKLNVTEEKHTKKEEVWWEYQRELKATFTPKYASTNPDFLTFADPEIFKDMRNNEKEDVVKRIREFFTLLAVCHTVVVDSTPEVPETHGSSPDPSEVNNDENPGNDDSTEESETNHSTLAIATKKLKRRLSKTRLTAIVPGLNSVSNLIGPGSSISSKIALTDDTVECPLKYKAESPDEAALVSAAKNLGFAFLSRNTRSVTIDILGKEHIFELLHILEFNSTRKRMSVIVRRPKELGGGIVLFCKGADSVIFERLADGQNDLVESTNQDIENFSNDGLRTLTLAYRVLEPSYYETWAVKYHKAITSVEDRAEEVDACSEEIENELILLGATAIEDKLQEGVPDTIASLRQACVKVWVLTGDKLETAINIGFAAQLLTQEMKLWIVKGSGREEAIRQFEEVFGSLIGKHGITSEERSLRHAFIVDGAALSYLLDSEATRQKILELSEVFHSVICCRVSPLQKALVVELVRKGKKVVTLAIGDGANDVSMIQSANVGVGISGQEGVQAAMAADYSIAQFRFLKKLLLVHGHWDYTRIAEMILNFFYKNVVWVFPVLWYQVFCMFSANIFYDYSFVQLYNMIFTVMPVVALGATDQSVTAKYCLEYPGIYALGIRQERYSRKRFAVYFLDGIWQSLIVYFTYHLIFLSRNVTSHDGLDAGPDDMSTGVAVAVVIIANLFVGFNTYNWTWIIFATVIGEIVILFAFVLVYGHIPATPLYGVGNQVFSEATFWIGLAFGILVAMFPRYLITFVKQWWFPDDLDIVRQIKTREKKERLATMKESPSQQNEEQNVSNLVIPEIGVNLPEEH